MFSSMYRLRIVLLLFLLALLLLMLSLSSSSSYIFVPSSLLVVFFFYRTHWMLGWQSSKVCSIESLFFTHTHTRMQTACIHAVWLTSCAQFNIDLYGYRTMTMLSCRCCCCCCRCCCVTLFIFMPVVFGFESLFSREMTLLWKTST